MDAADAAEEEEEEEDDDDDDEGVAGAAAPAAAGAEEEEEEAEGDGDGATGFEDAGEEAGADEPTPSPLSSSVEDALGIICVRAWRR